MNGQTGHQFYEMPESKIFTMTRHHVHGNRLVATEFSSWAASLHVVLCYAQSMRPEHNPHIAVLDRQQLDGEVLIWHVPDLVDMFEIEYLAHGYVKGSGYTAVPLKQLIEHGIYNIFPELSKADGMGHDLRTTMFSEPAIVTTDYEIAIAREIGALFNKLSLPIMIALLCLRPREPIGNTEQSRAQTAHRFITGLNIEMIDPGLASEPWLHSGQVYTSGRYRNFPDIKQWIELLHVISQYPPSQKRKRNEKAAFTRIYDLRPLPGRTRDPHQPQVLEEHFPSPEKKARHNSNGRKNCKK